MMPVTGISNLEEVDFGHWEGLTSEEIENKDAHEYKKWLDDPVKNHPPGGESLLDLKMRVLNKCSPLLDPGENEEIRHIMIVSHRGPLTVILTELLQIDISYFWNFRMDRGSVSKINIYPRFCELEYLNKKYDYLNLTAVP
jgi:broad specificity phosphatase PhoE